MSQKFRTDQSVEFSEIGNEILSFKLFDKKVCGNLIKRAESLDKWEASKVVGVDSSINQGRNSEQIWLRDDENLNKLYLTWVNMFLPPVIKEFWSYDMRGNTPSSIVRYKKGQFYNEHVDFGLGTDVRLVSLVCYLNDNFEGGETAFSRQGIKVKPETGKAILFPSGLTHRHSACDIISGTKYALVGWFY